MPLVAVDQINQTVAGITIYCSLNHKDCGLGIGQMAQTTEDNCTHLNFSIYSPYPFDRWSL